MFKAETNPLCPHEGTTLWSEINNLAAEIAESAAHIPTTHANDMHASLQCVRSLSDSIANLGACQDYTRPNEDLRSMSQACGELHFILSSSSVSSALKGMDTLAHHLKEKVEDLRLAVEEIMPPMPPADVVRVETQNVHQKHRLSFQLEHKVENLTKELHHKIQQCEELQAGNTDLRSELSRTLKEACVDPVELKEVQHSLTVFKATLAGIDGLDEPSRKTLYDALEGETLALANKMNQRLADVSTVSKRRSLLLEACEKENEDLKGLVSSMKGELQASLRLQAEIQKSSSRLPRFSERPSRHEEYILDLEEEVRHWQDETEQTRNELSDQLSENAALRKQLDSAEDKQQQFNAQLRESNQVPVLQLKEKLAAVEAELETYRENARRDAASKAEMQVALEELKGDLGDEEYTKLEGLVDEEMDDGGFPTPEWVRETINSGSLTSLNTGRLARKLTAMIKLSARTDEETEETEAVILEFVDKACEWKNEMYNLQREVDRQKTVIDVQEGELQRLQARGVARKPQQQDSASSTSHWPQRMVKSDGVDRVVELEMEVARMKSQMSGLEKASETKVRHLETQIEELEQELASTLKELEISESRAHDQLLHCHSPTHGNTMARCEAVMASLRNQQQIPQPLHSVSPDACSTSEPCSLPNMGLLFSAVTPTSSSRLRSPMTPPRHDIGRLQSRIRVIGSTTREGS